MDAFATPKVLLRRAIARDKADVLEFTRLIWEGHDYIPYVWDDWYMDPHGMLAVAEYGGRAVGMGKVSRVSQDQWWLEGLRVDPKFQGLKIATHIHEYLQGWWEQNARGTIRLMTSWQRVEVHHLCERFGWTKVGEVKEHMAPALAEAPRSLRLVMERELDEALRFAHAHLEHSRGLADFSWLSGAVDEELLQEECRGDRLLWWQADAKGPAGLSGLWEDEEDGELLLGIAFMACDIASLPDMLMDVRRLAGQRGRSAVMWLAPARDDVEAALHAASLESRWDGSAYIYELTRQS